MSVEVGSSYLPDAIEANHAGRLSDAQRANWSGIDRGLRKNELVGSGMLIIVGILLLTSTGPAPNAAYRPLVAIACFLAAGFFLYRALPRVDAIGNDLRLGQVEVVEGALNKQLIQVSSGRSSGETFLLHVAGHRFEVSRALYSAVPDGAVVRVYFLPRSKKAVNIERLPDRALPPDAMTSPGAFAGSVLSSMHSGDAAARAEAKASVLAMRDQMDAWTHAAPPAAGAVDPRPLAEAIVGSWHVGPMAWTFAADGTATSTLPNGRSQQGRWSVGADGRLDVTGLGGEQAVEAWVAGDTLTVAMGGRSIALQRAG